MAQEPGHIQITEFNKEVIPSINWMMEDLFCRYGVSIPWFMCDFKFPDYSGRPEWCEPYLPENVALYQNQWPDWLPTNGYCFGSDWGPWGYWLYWFNELLGLLFDTANLPRWQMPDLSPASWAMFNDYTEILYENAVSGKYYIWSEDDAGGIAQIHTGVDWRGTFTTTKRTTGTDYENIQDMGICVADGKVYMAYGHTEYFVGEQELWTAVMDEDGSNFSETKRRTFPDAKSWESQYVQIQIYGDKVYVAWIENDASFDGQVYVATMNLDGSGWSVIKHTGTTDDYTEVHMQLSGDKIYLVYGYSGSWKFKIVSMDLDGSNWAVLKTYTFSGTSWSGGRFQVVGSTMYLFWEETSATGEIDTFYIATRNIGYERLDITDKSAAFTVGETITGGTSGATAIVEVDTLTYLEVSGRSAAQFTNGETITGGTSESTATLSDVHGDGWDAQSVHTVDHSAYHAGALFGWTGWHRMSVEGDYIYLSWLELQGNYPGAVYTLWTGIIGIDKSGFSSTRRYYSASKDFNELEMGIRTNVIYYITRWEEPGVWGQGPICTATMGLDGSNFTLTERTNTTDLRNDVNLVV